jgi:MFS family permease
MELEEMQAAWSQMSKELEDQKKLTNSLIMEMTQQRYNSKLNTIMKYEGSGTVVCFIAGILLLFNFYRLDTWYLEMFGVLCLICFIGIPILSINAILRMKKLKLTTYNYKELVTEFTKRRAHFLMVQKLSVSAGFLMLFISLPVASKLLSNKDLFETGLNTRAQIFMVIFGIGLFFFARWGYRGYKKITASAGKMLEEVNE